MFLGSLGSLTDLRDQERRAFNRAFAEWQIDDSWSEATYRQILRRWGRFDGIYPALHRIPEGDRAAFLASVELCFRDLIDGTQPVLRPWAQALMAEARQRKLRLALIAGAERQTVLRVLAALFGTRASVVFDVVTNAEMAPAPKPAPDLYHAAMAHLSLEPGRVLAFETTADGVDAAQAAGIATLPALAEDTAFEDLSATTFGFCDTLAQALRATPQHSAMRPTAKDTCQAARLA